VILESGEFKKRYFMELNNNIELVEIIVRKARKEDLVLLYGPKDEEHNNALAYREFIKAHMKARQ
jgi:uncharacterized protein YeaO (DUF488 family)